MPPSTIEPLSSLPIKIAAREAVKLDRHHNEQAGFSEAQRQTVLAVVGGAEQDTARVIDTDRLTSADRLLGEARVVSARRTRYRPLETSAPLTPQRVRFSLLTLVVDFL